MAGIPFVTREIDRAIDVDREVRVHLNEAAVSALIPVVAAPRLVPHVLDREALLWRQLHVPQRAPAPLGDRAIEHRRHAVGWDHEPLTERLVAIGERAGPRQPTVDRL